MVRGDWSRDFPRHQWDRYHLEAPPDETRYHESHDGRRLPVAIEKALREQCAIPARHFYLAAILDDGSEQIFSGPGRYNPNLVPQMFDWNTFRRETGRSDSGVTSVDEVDSPFGDPYRQQFGSGYGSGSGERTRRTSEIFAEEETFRPRKRNRGHRRSAAEEDDVPVVTTGSKRGLKIGDSAEVWKLYDQRFRNCQQTACKLIAKAWVKVVEPKKQTNHPYTGSDEKAPAWWPKPWGKTKEERVRHKEPDHLYKRERVHLLCHILRMIVEPREKQHPSIQKLGLDVKKLREATDEALSLFFSGKDNEKNLQKKPYLDEIFKIARLEERYKNGEIDADTQAWVMSEEKFSDAAPFDDDGGLVKDETDHPSGTSSASPPKAVITTHEGLIRGSGSEHSPTSQAHIQGSGFMHELSVRGTTQYSNPMLPPNMHTEQHFVENSGLQPPTALSMHDMVPGPPDSHRRSSLYTSPTDYSNPSSSSLYNQAWSAGSAAPGTAPMYSFPGQQSSSAQGQFTGHSTTVPMPQNQYIHAQYETTLQQRGTFDQGNMYRSAAASSNPGGYSGYLTADGRPLANSPVKPDSLPRGGLE